MLLLFECWKQTSASVTFMLISLYYQLHGLPWNVIRCTFTRSKSLQALHDVPEPSDYSHIQRKSFAQQLVRRLLFRETWSAQMRMLGARRIASACNTRNSIDYEWKTIYNSLPMIFCRNSSRITACRRFLLLAMNLDERGVAWRGVAWCGVALDSRMDSILSWFFHCFKHIWFGIGWRKILSPYNFFKYFWNTLFDFFRWKKCSTIIW